MDTKIQLQKNAKVLTADGQQVGSLHRIVVNATTNVLTSLIVRTGSLLNHEERVVPIDLVAQITEEQILLHDRPGSLEALSPFEERHLIDENSHSGANHSVEDMPLIMYGRPDVGMPAVGVPISSDPADQFVTQIEQNIPAGTVAVKEGATVITAEGKHVGHVESVFADAAAEQITHLLISNGLITKEKKLVPIDWVTVLGEDEIHLRVEKHSVDELADVSAAL